jgi:hypothetical protein
MTILWWQQFLIDKQIATIDQKFFLSIKLLNSTKTHAKVVGLEMWALLVIMTKKNSVKNMQNLKFSLVLKLKTYLFELSMWNTSATTLCSCKSVFKVVGMGVSQCYLFHSMAV